MIPFWLKEILEKGDLPCRYKIFDENTVFGVINSQSDELKKISSLQSYPNKVINKKNIAFFRDGPFLPPSTGAIVSMLGEMEALAFNGYNVYLFYCFRGWNDPSLYYNKKFTTIFINPNDFYINKCVITSLIKKFGIYLCQIDSAEAVVSQAPLIHPEAKIVFEVHNIEYDLMSQLGADSRKVGYMRITESKAINLSDLVLFRSQQNQDLLEAVSGEINNAKIYRGCINTEAIKFNLKKGKTRNILFLGHLNYAPNAQAVDIIARRIAPFVDAKFVIAGVGSDILERKYKNPNITFLGRVDDLNKLFIDVEIGLSPLVTGSGTRLKILDYMAAGIPVIGTSLSIDGLEQEIKGSMIIEDDISKYPAVVNKLLRNRKEIVQYSVSGRRFVEKYRDWKACISDVISGYDQIDNHENKTHKAKFNGDIKNHVFETWT